MVLLSNPKWIFDRQLQILNSVLRVVIFRNLSKHGYLYDCGMKIAIRNKKSGWTRGGTDILYRNNGILKRPLDETS